MFSTKTIKGKLILLVVISLVTLSAIISITTIVNSQNALVQSKFQQLASIEASKKSEISNYLNSIKSLLTSLAANEGTKDALLAFEDGFYKLENEIALDLTFVKDRLADDFEKNYLNQVNYSVPNSESRKNIRSYLPTDPNALIAQYIFITDNAAKLGEKNKLTYSSKYDSTYMKAHKKYHKSFDAFLNSYSLYDIFMVDTKGNLIYTDFKEKDYATNLSNGVYKDTGIASVYKEALSLKEGEIAFDDFRPYEPSYNAAASFISTPIYIDGNLKGVLIFQMPVDIINSIMQFGGKFKESGMGESGEAYLVGQDYLMRSNSRFQADIKDDVVSSLGTTVGVWNVKTKSVLNAFENKQGEWIIPDYRGVNVLSAYTPLDVYGKTTWALIAEIDEEEALAESTYIMYSIILVSIIVSLIIIAITILVINKSLVQPIKELQNYLELFLNFLSLNSNSFRKIEPEDSQFAEMIEFINVKADEFDAKLKADMKVIGELTLTLDKVEQGIFKCRVKATTNNPMVMTLRKTVNTMLDEMEKNMKELERVTSSYANNDFREKIDISPKLKARLLAVMQGINTLGEALSNSARKDLTNGENLQQNSENMKHSMNNLAAKANEQAASLEETAASLEEITSLTRSNGENAIKLAQFGSSVKKSVSEGQVLASKTASSMEEINEKVTSINEAITVIDQIAFQTNILSLNAAVEAATAGEAGKGFAVVAQEVRNLAARSAEAAKEIKELVEDANTKANEGKSISSDMIEGYENLNNEITKNISIIEEVTTASKEQLAGIEQINDAMNMLDRVTQENAREANQVTSISNEVSTMAQELVIDAQNKKFN